MSKTTKITLSMLVVLLIVGLVGQLSRRLHHTRSTPKVNGTVQSGRICEDDLTPAPPRVVNDTTPSPTIATNAHWDWATIAACWAQLGPFTEAQLSSRKAFVALTNAAQRADASPPHDGHELLRCIYTLPLTNEGEGFVFSIISGVTNEAHANLLVWAFTNFHFLGVDIAGVDSMQQQSLMGKSDSSVLALVNMGTPALMDRLNKLLRQLQNEGTPIYEACHTIDPRKYPVEARAWLLNYPEPRVRYNMCNEWLRSGRPETPILINEYCTRVNSMPDDFYLWKGEPNIVAAKRREIKATRMACDEYVRKYKRWMADGQKEGFNSGYYDDENWDQYMTERHLP
jgi:hypothetical protein